MFYKCYDERKCIFIHVPKVAGISIEASIYNDRSELGGHRRALLYAKTNYNKYDEYFSFGFVRNPYDRLVSAFFFLKKGGLNSNDLKFSNSFLKKYDTFKDFVLDLKDQNICKNILEWVHFRPQTYWLCDDDNNVLVKFVGKFEQLEEDFKKILEIINLQTEIKHINKTTHRPYLELYDNEMLEIVENVYKSDFEVFGYQKLSSINKKIGSRKIYLCSFADTRLCLSAYRFKKQAEAVQVFDEIFIYNETNLPLAFKQFFNSKLYINGKPTRGFGYWCWKPKVILMTLEQIKENDILIYLDIGFEINFEKRKHLLEMIEMIIENNIMGMKGPKKYTRKQWQKMDTLIHYNLKEDDMFLNSQSNAAGFIALIKTKVNESIIQEWMDVFYSNWNFIDDSPSKHQNLDCFIENRHDQSIWNILCYKYNIKCFSEKYHNPRDNSLSLQCNRNKVYLPNEYAKAMSIHNDIKYDKIATLVLEKNKFAQLVTTQNKIIAEFDNNLKSTSAIRQQLEISNLEQDLINKKLQTKQLERQLGLLSNDAVVSHGNKITIIHPNSAKSRIQNQLSYKLGQAMIINSKSLLGYIRMPFVLSYIKDKHKQEQKIYQEKIKKDPSLKLPPLENYPDYKEALKEKECLTYKLGEALIKASNNWYGGGYIKLLLEIRKLKREFRKKANHA